MKNKNWFEVSREGLRELQAGKPKDFVVRELIQNAWDEDISICCLNTTHQNGGVAEIRIEDDSPEGFRDLSHAFTLFASTYKRGDPEKRGRFNIGEKQVLAVCLEAVISTTKGTITFDSNGRSHNPQLKLKKGSIIKLKMRMSKEEYEEMVNSINLYLPPKGISFSVNGATLLYREPYKVVDTALPTEIQKENKVVKAYRKTKIQIHKADGVAYIYEMGLPICKIDCAYHVDVQQKVPMSIDRDRVSQSYLQKIFALVLNETCEEVLSENSSDSWVREGMGNKNVSEEAVRSIVKSRYGDKVVVATPGDRRSVDEAIAHGYRVIYGSELSRPEWENVRKADAIHSSSTFFPSSSTDDAEEVEKDDNMIRVEKLAKKIAKRCLGIDITVQFLKWTGVGAQYGHRTLVFNVKKLGERFFNPPVNARVIDVIVHELAHEKGLHTEISYHNCLTKMAGKLVMIALEEPKFFKGLNISTMVLKK